MILYVFNIFCMFLYRFLLFLMISEAFQWQSYDFRWFYTVSHGFWCFVNVCAISDLLWLWLCVCIITSPYFTLPYAALPYSFLPYPTLLSSNLPYPILPCPTLHYRTLPTLRYPTPLYPIPYATLPYLPYPTLPPLTLSRVDIHCVRRGSEVGIIFQSAIARVSLAGVMIVSWELWGPTTPSTTNHQPSTSNHQPSTIKHQSSTINHHLWTIKHQPSTIKKAGRY